MKYEPASDLAVIPTGKRKSRISKWASSAVSFSGLAVILLLAIPVCLLLGLIGCIWSVTDKLVRVIDH